MNSEHYVYVSHSMVGGYYKVASEMSAVTMSDGDGCWKSLIPVNCLECGQMCHDNPPDSSLEAWFCERQCAWSWLFRLFYVSEDLSE